MAKRITNERTDYQTADKALLDRAAIQQEIDALDVRIEDAKSSIITETDVQSMIDARVALAGAGVSLEQVESAIDADKPQLQPIKTDDFTAATGTNNPVDARIKNIVCVVDDGVEIGDTVIIKDEYGACSEARTITIYAHAGGNPTEDMIINVPYGRFELSWEGDSFGYAIAHTVEKP